MAARKFADKIMVKPLKANFTDDNKIFGRGKYIFKNNFKFLY
jgi:hypothetical protein